MEGRAQAVGRANGSLPILRQLARRGCLQDRQVLFRGDRIGPARGIAQRVRIGRERLNQQRIERAIFPRKAAVLNQMRIAKLPHAAGAQKLGRKVWQAAHIGRGRDDPL